MEGEARLEKGKKKAERKRRVGKKQQQRQGLKEKVRRGEDIRVYSKIKSLTFTRPILRKTEDYRS